MERTDMDKLRDIIRLGEGRKLNQRAIAQTTGVSPGTVNHVLGRVREAGLTWAAAQRLEPSALQATIYPPSPQATAHLEPDWDSIIETLKAQKTKRRRREPRVTRVLLWREYCEEAEAQHRTAYSRSQFYSRLKALARGPAGEAEMHFDYEPGEILYSDFSGKTMAIKTRGGERLVEILVALLPCSNLIFAIAVPDQTLKSWCEAHRLLLDYLKGTPQRLICDNLKAAVATWIDGDPRLNETFRAFARHYNIAVLPARRYSPRDKGAVENAVKIVQTGILAALRHQSFFSLGALNAALAEKLDELNHRTMVRHGMSRWQCFAATDAPALSPLPERPWVHTWTIERTVGPNYHVQFEYNLYSVPAQHRGRKVIARVCDKTVEILSMDRQRLAIHPRLFGRNQYSTQGDHMPSNHRAMQQRGQPGYQDMLCHTLRAIGPNSKAWVERAVASHDFPEQALRTLMGAERLSRRHPQAAFEAACQAALAAERFGYGFLRDWLRKPHPGAPREPEEWLPDHQHIRGSNYYKEIGRC